MDVSRNAEEIVEEFGFFDDWEDRYQHLIDLGRKLPPLDPSVMVEENRLRGCQSVVHFKADYDAPLLHFHAGSDAAIVQGLIALMLRVYSGQRPEDIMATQPEFLHQIGLDEHLSPTRKNGLASLVTAIMTAAENANR
ncbi:MAG: SufE family protein [Candidatus Puniceispirillales bacterium]